MKPETATAIAVSLLLACSVLCVGGRQRVDRRNAELQGKKALAVPPDPEPRQLRPAAAPARVPAPPSGPKGSIQHLRGIFSTSYEVDRTRAMLGLFSTFKENSDWQRAMDLANEAGMGAGSRWFNLMLIAWAETDPQAAMDWAIAKGSGTISVIRTWIVKDPEAARAFIRSIEDDHGKNMQLKAQLFVGAIEALGHDLPQLGQVLDEIPKDWNILQGARMQFAGIPPDTLHAWAESFEPPLRGQVMSLVFSGMKGAEAKLAMAERYPQELGPGVYNRIYQEWLGEDEAGAVKSLESLEPGPTRPHAAAGTVEWLRTQGRLAEAIALTKRWPDDFAENVLANLLVYQGDPKDAPLILSEIPRLKSDRQRLDHYHATLQSWLRSEPEAARKWLADNEVPEKVRKEFEGK